MIAHLKRRLGLGLLAALTASALFAASAQAGSFNFAVGGPAGLSSTLYCVGTGSVATNNAASAALGATHEDCTTSIYTMAARTTLCSPDGCSSSSAGYFACSQAPSGSCGTTPVGITSATGRQGRAGTWGIIDETWQYGNHSTFWNYLLNAWDPSHCSYKIANDGTPYIDCVAGATFNVIPGASRVFHSVAVHPVHGSALQALLSKYHYHSRPLRIGG